MYICIAMYILYRYAQTVYTNIDIGNFRGNDVKETKETPAPKKKKKLLTVRVGEEELMMIEVLKQRPYHVNISDYVRSSIKRLYEVRTKKAGRVK